VTIEYVSCFVGAGFTDDAVEVAASRDLAFVGADAGTIDVGPYQLGGLGTIFTEELCRHDLRRLVALARRREVPLVIGSCAGSGSDSGVDTFAGIVRETTEAGRSRPLRVARIYSEIARKTLRDKIRSGQLHALPGPHLDFTETQLDASERIVAVMGAEPLIAALEAGADVVLAGRTTDSAVFAALPLMRGVSADVAWHAGKVAECGSAIAEPVRNDLLHVQLDDSGFVVEPLNPSTRCTPWSVAAHQLYENADPTAFIEPSGTLDVSNASFDASSDRAVRVSGGVFRPATRQTMKLEGVEKAGYQSIAMMSYTDSVLLETYDEWLSAALVEVEAKAARVFGADAATARLSVRTYGAGSGTGLYPTSSVAGSLVEAFLLLDVVAPTQSMASSYATIAWHTLCHFPTKGWTGGFVTAAWPFNPPVIDRGAVFRFNVNHVIEVESQLDVVRIEYEDVG
jgi:hypothetical protein